MTSDAEQVPCVGCGLCCDGTLFSRARLQPDEQDKLAKTSCEPVTFDGELFFRLPCPHFAGDRCGIYEERFLKCRSFKCALLRKFDAGEMSLADSREIVAEAKLLVDRVRQADPNAILERARPGIRASLSEGMATAAASERTAIADRLVRIIALDEFLDRHFVNKDRQTRE